VTRKKVGCYDCGMPYGEDGWIEAIIPDALWREISPTHDDGGILCISCISKRLSRAGLQWVPVWLCGCEPLEARVGDPEIAILRHANPDDYRIGPRAAKEEAHE